MFLNHDIFIWWLLRSGLFEFKDEIDKILWQTFLQQTSRLCRKFEEDDTIMLCAKIRLSVRMLFWKNPQKCLGGSKADLDAYIAKESAFTSFFS